MPIRYSSNRWGHKKKKKKKNGGIKKKNRELSIIPATACLSIKVIVAKMSGKKMTKGHNNPKPDLDNINGQIIILNQILIISMHIASLVKRPCYLFKLLSRKENMGMSRAENSVKI